MSSKLKSSKSGRVTDLRKGTATPYVGRFWIEVEYHRDGVLRIEQLNDVTRFAVNRKADARINELLADEN